MRVISLSKIYYNLLTIYKFAYRYEYDDHYFLTDPREFIYEFFPLQPEWQLLKNPITQRDFEDLPFVRSLFFRYGLYFPDSNTKAVMYTDATGKNRIHIFNLIFQILAHISDKLQNIKKLIFFFLTRNIFKNYLLLVFLSC